MSSEFLSVTFTSPALLACINMNAFKINWIPSSVRLWPKSSGRERLQFSKIGFIWLAPFPALGCFWPILFSIARACGLGTFQNIPLKFVFFVCLLKRSLPCFFETSVNCGSDTAQSAFDSDCGSFFLGI